MKDLADNFGSLTDRWFANEKQSTALKAKYVAKYQKVLPTVRT
jgi:hypothetical protein